MVARGAREPAGAVLGDTAVLRLAGRVHDDLVGAGPARAAAGRPGGHRRAGQRRARCGSTGAPGCSERPVALGGADEVRRLAQRLAAGCGRRLDDGQPVRRRAAARRHPAARGAAAGGDRRAVPVAADVPAAAVHARRPGRAAARCPAGRAAAGGDRGAPGWPTWSPAAPAPARPPCSPRCSALVPPTERIVLVEDAAELRPVHPHVVAPAGAYRPTWRAPARSSCSDLVRQALRMRPDRLVVGECRGAEIVDLLARAQHRPRGRRRHAARQRAGRRAGPAGGARAARRAAPGGAARPGGRRAAGGAARAAHRSGRVLDSICVLLPSGSERLVTVVPAWRRGARARAGGAGAGPDVPRPLGAGAAGAHRAQGGRP